MTKKVTKKSLEKLRDEKFGNNTFAKKWKHELDNEYTRGYNEGATAQIEALENASQVKSWSRHERARTLLEATNIFLAILR